jgi:hypothetical protein
MKIAKFTIGMGDRFGHQGTAQLHAAVEAERRGIAISPAWNKSHREHTLIGSAPGDVRIAANAAVAALGWKGPFYLDADHVNEKSVDGFVDSCNFFTLDVAEFIGTPAPEPEIDAFVEWAQGIALPELPFLDYGVGPLRGAAKKFLLAAQEAGRIYRRIAFKKGSSAFVTEVSMDETTHPQTPSELVLILAMLRREGVPVQTIAPKFCGEFHKGVDYIGDVDAFETEFDQHVAVVEHAKRMLGLPLTLKLSVHSGSDKFSIYPAINRVIKKHGAGLHVKTAGTTWLEELLGLAESGGEALDLAKDIYEQAYNRREELCAPYATVIGINPEALPEPATVRGWNAEAFSNALRHDPQCAEFRGDFRQLLHIAFRIAAEMKPRFSAEVSRNESRIAKNVTQNLLDRHMVPIFG